jgi:hypothetical protein
MEPLLISLALLALPIAAGLTVGFLVRLLSGRRLKSAVAALLMATLPLLVVLWLYPSKPIVGFWDCVFEGLLVGIGVLVGGHALVGGDSWFESWRQLGLATVSTVLTLCLLEAYARWSLPPAPAFGIQGMPHLFLADALLANNAIQSWDIGANEVVCSAVYGDRYRRQLNTIRDVDLTLPQNFSPRSGASRHVMHLGDSMVYGVAGRPDQRFTSLLEQLEPGTQHINAALPGLGPDSYAALIRPWVDAHPIDMIVMYLYEGNDYSGLDSPSPCCKFEPILSYADGRASLRCATPYALDLDGVRLNWLRIISPPPYVLRALLPYSRLAAKAAASLVAGRVSGDVSESNKATLDTIMQTAAEQLRSRGIAFVTVVLPNRPMGDRESDSARTRMMESARKAGVPAFDAYVPVRAAMNAGVRPFLGADDLHFSPAGHQLMAQWLDGLLNGGQGSATAPEGRARPVTP